MTKDSATRTPPTRRRYVPLIVGMAPASTAPQYEPGVAFVGSDSGRRLAALAGLESDEELVEHFTLTNVFPAPIREWRSADAQLLAEEILRSQVRRRTHHLILCGVQVCSAFGELYTPYFEWRSRRVNAWRYRVATMPHPSGLARTWNDPRVGERARAFFEEMLG